MRAVLQDFGNHVITFRLTQSSVSYVVLWAQKPFPKLEHVRVDHELSYRSPFKSMFSMATGPLSPHIGSGVRGEQLGADSQAMVLRGRSTWLPPL